MSIISWLLTKIKSFFEGDKMNGIGLVIFLIAWIATMFSPWLLKGLYIVVDWENGLKIYIEREAEYNDNE